MDNNTLPPELFPIIFHSIPNPVDWINCMSVNTSWYNILFPLYLDTNFHIIFLKKSNIPKCLRELYTTTKKCKITNPTLVYYHFLFDSSTPVFTVKGLYLPFVTLPKSGQIDQLVFSYGKYMEHYTFKFPITQPYIFNKIQQISLHNPKFTKSKVNYHQILLSEFNQYYASHPYLINSSKYWNDLNTIKRFEKYPYTQGCLEMTKLKYYFSQNSTAICPFCHDTHKKLF